MWKHRCPRRLPEPADARIWYSVLVFDHHASLAGATAEGCRRLVDDMVARGSRNVALLVAEGAPLELTGLVGALGGVKAEVTGAVFPALISQGVVSRDGAVALGFTGSAKRVVFRNLGGSSSDLENEMSRLYSSSKGARAHSVLLFLDAVAGSPYCGRFMETLQLYFHLSARYIGGGAGRSDLSSRPCLFTEGEILPGAAAVALRLDRDISLSYRHGWTRLAGPFFVSRAEDTRVLELDWRPAIEVYAEALREAGHEPGEAGLDYNRIAPIHPLGLLKMGELVVVRDLLTVSEERGLETFGRIPQHAVLSVLRGESESLLTAARQVAEEVRSMKPSGSAAPKAFVADCVTRETALGERFQEELDILTEVFGSDVVGALTLGEVASGRDRFIDFLNKTIVVGA